MKTKLKIIIPIIVAIAAVILAAVCIKFNTNESYSLEAIMSTAQQYLTEQKYEQAAIEFEKAIQIDPRNVDAYIGIAQAYELIGDTEKALEWLHKGYDLTGDPALKAEIDRLGGSAEADVTTEQTTEETAESNNIEELTEISTIDNVEKNLEKKIVYADNWYSIFKYDENENIISMDLYTSSDKKRLSANYEYSGSSVKRTVYVDDVMINENDVAFSDIMAEVEAEKKERANTTKKFDTGYFIYDDKGDLIESSWHNVNSNGEMVDSGECCWYSNGVITKQNMFSDETDKWTFFDEKGYPIKSTGTFSGKNISWIYTYDYDENGYPIVQYLNGEKDCEFINVYKNSNLAYSFWHAKDEINNNHGLCGNSDSDNMVEVNDNKQYLRMIVHDYYDFHTDQTSDINQHSYIVYYVLSYDDSRVIDKIIAPKTELPLFGCPFCYEE